MYAEEEYLKALVDRDYQIIFFQQKLKRKNTIIAARDKELLSLQTYKKSQVFQILKFKKKRVCLYKQ